jgi:hypothetical protein
VAAALFALPAVDGLYFGPDFITVTRTRPAASSAALAWEGGLKDEIVAYLEVFCEEQQGQQDAKEAARMDSSSQFDDPTEALIVDIIETQVAAAELSACMRASLVAGARSGARGRRQHRVQAVGRQQRHSVGADGGRVRGMHHVQGHSA